MAGSFFNSLDYVYIFLTLISCLIGFFRGFIKDFFSTCAWIGSGFVSSFVAPYLAHSVQLSGTISNPLLAKIAAIVASFIIVLITLLLTVNAISKRVKSTAISGLDRAFGALYGFFRGFILLIIVCICTIMFDLLDFRRGFVADSKITPILVDISDYLLPKIMSIPHIKKKVSLPKIKEDMFTEEEIREMERLSREIIEKSKQEKASQEKGISDYFDGLISKFKGDASVQTDDHRATLPMRSSDKRMKIKNKEDNVQFGCMDLMKARAKRRAQKKAERIKMDRMKRLDNHP